MTSPVRRFDPATLSSNRLLTELSLWSADLMNLGTEVARVDELADIYHIDTADGHFSPYMLFFPDVVAQLRPLTQRPLHVHLMMADSILDEQIDQFAEAGADLISIHAENKNVDAAISRIESHGCAAGVVLQLHTQVSAVEKWIDRLSIITLLGTRMGVKGQDLAPEACERLVEARQLINRYSAQNRIILAADGAIRTHTVPMLRESGADTVVMGSLAFNAESYEDTINWSRSLR